MVRSLGLRYAKWLTLLMALLALGALVTGVLAQDSGEFVPGQSDTQLNVGVSMGGANVYCVNEYGIASASYEDGGFQVLDPQGQEMLFVPAATIDEAFSTLEQTGQYVTLGVSERPWYGGAPIAIYLLTSGEFQMNAADEWGKPVEFQWTECRNVTTSTSDGCKPGWDRDNTGRCVFENLY